MLAANYEEDNKLNKCITNGGEWTELFDNKRIKNRGIIGDTSEEIYDRLDNIVNGKPQKIFILIGINDISQKISTDQSAMNIEKIVLKIKTVSPHTKIYLQSVMLVNSDFNKFKDHMKPDSIKQLNFKISNLSKKHEVTYINLYSILVEEKTDKLQLQSMRGFEITEIDGLYYPANAEVENDKIKLWSEKTKTPKYVRYGWRPFTRANVINEANLPMSTFKTENKNNIMMRNKCTPRSTAEATIYADEEYRWAFTLVPIENKKSRNEILTKTY